MIVRYEDLVQESEKVVHGICATIEEEFENEMLSVEYNNSSSDVAARGIYSVSVGVWKQNLRKEDVYVGQLLAGNELRQLGYAIERVKVNPFRIVAVFLTFPFALLRALYASRQMRGPLTSYILRRAWGLFSRAWR